MSKILPASCTANVVKIENKPVTATVLSQGVKASTGAALVEEDVVTYITSNATDIKDLITNLGDVVDKIITIVTGLDGGAPTPGTQAANIALLSTLKATMIAQKDMLK